MNRDKKSQKEEIKENIKDKIKEVNGVKRVNGIGLIHGNSIKFRVVLDEEEIEE